MGFISVVVQRDSSGAPTFSDDEESLLHSQPHTRLFVSSSNRLVGEGVLLITTKRVVWLAEVPAAADDANGYAVGYHSLLMHAISTDTEHFANPSIYCQLEQPEEDEGEEEEEDEEEGEADDTSANTPLGDAVLRAGEARFVPDDPAAVELLYAKMSEGAELNPDEVEEGEGDFMFDHSSLQVAPGVNVHALLGGADPMEHAGEEFDEEEDEEEGEEEGEGQGERVEVAGLEVTGYHVALSPRGREATTMEEEDEEKAGAEDDVEHHDG